MSRSRVKYTTRKQKSGRVREELNVTQTQVQRAPVNCIICGDCVEQLRNLPSDSVDLIFTSPPYAEARKNTYGGIHPDRCAEWFLPITSELLRVLKPTSSFVLNIKEKALHGERHPYVIETILGMRKSFA
jgi:DNA modification methylase